MNLPISDLPLFLLGTALLVWFSWKPLRHPGSHGFYRFFAWEAILALIVQHREYEGGQVISQTLLIISVLFLVLGYSVLLMRGRAGGDRQDGALYGWERTTTLITTGIYGLIRHPMYASLLALDWAMFFRAVSLPGFALAATASIFLQRTAQAEEKECLAYFGEPYSDYMQRTRRFIPFLY
jgi:protein-S-isoprenylcysteine O-methyltransferase Ste14